MSKMSNEALILNESLEMYNKLQRIYEQEKDRMDSLELGRLLFKTVSPGCHPGGRRESPTYVIFDGKIKTGDGDYTIGKSISENSKDSDFNVLIEDLTKAYYVMNGGKMYTYTPKFIQALKEMDEQ